MYFPFFRGKRFELLTIREIPNIVDTSRVIPIIEPVKENLSDIQKCGEKLEATDCQCIIVSNPGVGELIGEYEKVADEIIDQAFRDVGTVIPALLITSTTSDSELKWFCQRFSDRPVAIIHMSAHSDVTQLQRAINSLHVKYHVYNNSGTGRGYQKSFSGQSVILNESFKKADRNADYPEDEFYSDTHNTFAPNYDGFGDFLTVGREFSDTGFTPYAVALHLTYEHTSGDIWIRHFVSDRTSKPVDVKGKFSNALGKLIYFSNNNGVYNSEGLGEYMEYHKISHYPGLGKVKQLSMMHHIELVSKLF